MIYMAVCDNNPELFKIGFSFNPTLRVKQFNSSKKAKFTIVKTYSYIGDDKYGPEMRIHDRLSEFRAEDFKEALGVEVYLGEVEYFNKVIESEILVYNGDSSARSQRDLEDEELEENPRYIAISKYDAVHKFLSLQELEAFAKHRTPSEWNFFKLTEYTMDVTCKAVEIKNRLNPYAMPCVNNDNVYLAPLQARGKIINEKV